VPSMGTAPGQQQSPAMPDPARTVTRALTLLKARDIQVVNGLAIVCQVTARCIDQLTRAGITDVAWLADVHLNAANRLAVLTPSNSDSSGGENGDGSGSGASGNARQSA
jgi:hypothetical protein